MECINMCYRNMQDLDALADRIDRHPADQVLIQVFSGVATRNRLLQLQSELVRFFPGRAILGVTNEDEILGADVLNKGIVISVSLFSSTKVRTHAVDDISDDSRDGKQLGEHLHATGTRLAILFVTGAHGGRMRNSTTFIQALGKAAAGVTICGGQAGIDRVPSNTYVFTADTLTSTGAVAASFQGKDLRFWNFRSDGWKPIGRPMEIATTDGFHVRSIDNRSIREVYDLYLGLNARISTLQNPTLEFPLIYRRGGLLRKNVPIGEGPDGSFEYLMKFTNGDKVRFSYCDISMLETEAQKIKRKLFKASPQAIFIYSCSARKRVFGGEIAIDSKGFEEIASLAGFFTSTEFFTTPNGTVHCLIQNMTLLALTEGPPHAGGHAVPKFVAGPKQGTPRATRVLRMLTRLISVTSEELERSNRRLNEMAHIDTMTGLFNRRYFDRQLGEEIRKKGRTNPAPLSLIMLDIDYFKQYNDTYGHTAGDECLTTIGRLLREALRRSSDIAFRYGGEEMGCLLPATDFAGARGLAEKILVRIRAESIPHEASKVAPHVTASIGFITFHFNHAMLPESRTVIDLCDQMLYRAKEEGRDRTIGGEYTSAVQAEKREQD